MHEFSKNREMRTYSYGELETPFQAKAQNEDQELGRFIKATDIYKTISLISLLASFLLLLVLMSEVVKPHIHVLYAGVLPSGFVKGVGYLTAMS